MAKNPFPGTGVPKGRAPRKTARRRSVSAGTFIQRSRQVPSEEKAAYHNALGAGRRGTIRRFFDLSEDDQGTLREKLGELVEMRLKSA
jgi:hypothetical protein